MPPKAKFSREEIIEAALDIVRAEGMEALTSRTLGAKLGSSARPIFTVFQSMEEVKQCVTKSAKALYREYVKRGLSDTPAFKSVGKQYVLFAIREPKLFQLLFMSEQGEIPDLSGVLSLIEDSYGEIFSAIQNGYGLEKAAAEKLYYHLWIYTHGIAVLCATHMCRFTAQEISDMMSEVCRSILHTLKTEGSQP